MVSTNTVWVAVTTVLFSVSLNVYGMDQRAPYQRLQGPKHNSTKKNYFNLPQVRKNSHSLLQKRSFSLLKSGAIGLNAAVASFVAEHEELLGLKLVPRSKKAFSLKEATDNESYSVAFNGVEFCNANIKAFQFSQADEPLILGSLPEFYSGQNIGGGDWDDFTDVLNHGLQTMESRGFHGASFATGSESRCIFVRAGQMFPAWRFTMLHHALPYEAIATVADIFQLDAKFFNVNGQGKAYARNPHYPTPASPEIENVTIVGLIGDGKLTNDVFTTSPVDIPRLNDANHDFSTVDPGDPGFPEMNVFIHANHTLAWFEGLGFTYTDEKKLVLQTNYTFTGGDINNAVYSPQNGPRILIANGGPVNGQKRLENLSLDRDVVSHEFAHHVIYQSVTTTTEDSESLVLHEGLSDTLTFLRTKDACLGESICPADSTFNCFQVGQCLRSAENSYVFGDPELDQGAHIKSQFVSGMIWDLQKNGLISNSVLSSIVVKAISMLLNDSGYLHLILAMMNVDRMIYNGQYSCDIYNAAFDRGLGSVLTFNCDDATLPAIDESTSQPVAGDIDRTSGSGSSAGAKEGNKTTSLCGFIHVPAAGSWYILLLLLLAPLLATMRQSRD